MTNRVINDRLLDRLLAEAEASPRLRMNLDLRNSPGDQSQRMLNALMPGTVVPIHRHRMSSETVVLLRGCCSEIFYDEKGVERDRVELGGDAVGVNIPKGQWHTIVAHVPSVIVEMKEGAYEPLSSEDVWSYE